MAKPGVTDITDLWQLIYSSQPFGYDAATLNGVLLDARRCNARDGISGALICRDDIYLQLLEGPETAVRTAFERIARDDRHLDIRTHLSESISRRSFGQWAMLHDPARSWIWSREEIAAGALDRASAEEVRGVFDRLAQESADPPA